MWTKKQLHLKLKQNILDNLELFEGVSCVGLILVMMDIRCIGKH